MDDNHRDWLTLALAPGIGPATTDQLLTAFGSPAGTLAATDAQLGQAGLKPATIRALRKPDPESLQRTLDWLAAPEHHLITMDQEDFPPLLKRIADCPPILFVHGDPGLLHMPQIAIVGSRSATQGGLDNARHFAASLARAGFAITSGLAAGVDAAAHQACLDAGGRTLAVCGTGPDRIYPARHLDLARRLVEQGALVSPFCPGTDVRRSHFPFRNRIISGLSLGTLVVEAGVRSGSLITARLAAEQGREVFAIPGSIHNPGARGCHRLIRDGASLVEEPGEILTALEPLARELAGELQSLLSPADDEGLEDGQEMPHIAFDPDYRALLKAVGFDPTPIDTIIERSQLKTSVVSSMLLMLELEGLVSAHPGGRYSRTREVPE